MQDITFYYKKSRNEVFRNWQTLVNQRIRWYKKK